MTPPSDRFETEARELIAMAIKKSVAVVADPIDQSNLSSIETVRVFANLCDLVSAFARRAHATGKAEGMSDVIAMAEAAKIEEREMANLALTRGNNGGSVAMRNKAQALAELIAEANSRAAELEAEAQKGEGK